MIIKYNKPCTIDTKKIPMSMNNIIKFVWWIFEEVLKTKTSNTINFWRDKYISIDYDRKWYCSCYIDLWNTYLRWPYSLEHILHVIRNDPYIKRNFK